MKIGVIADQSFYVLFSKDPGAIFNTLMILYAKNRDQSRFQRLEVIDLDL